MLRQVIVASILTRQEIRITVLLLRILRGLLIREPFVALIYRAQLYYGINPPIVD